MAPTFSPTVKKQEMKVEKTISDHGTTKMGGLPGMAPPKAGDV